MILVFRVPFRDLGDFWDPEMQAPAGPRLAIWERPEIPIVSLLSGGEGGGDIFQGSMRVRKGSPVKDAPHTILRMYGAENTVWDLVF